MIRKSDSVRWMRLSKRFQFTTLLILTMSLGVIGQAQGQRLATPPPTNTPRVSTPSLPPTTAVPAASLPAPTSQRPGPSDQPTLVIMGTYDTPDSPLTTAIPPAAPAPDISGDVTTLLLLGSDTIT